jgi:MoaA/NifB/PqqE/SkfB family radical SAM enzyme
MHSTIWKLAGRLAINGLRFQYLKRTGHPGKPQALSLEVTHHCIAKCIMCNIWKIPDNVEDMPLAQWVNLLSSELFSDLRELDITGGEPFLRKDLPRLFDEILRLKKFTLGKLKSIAVTTNGLLTDRVLNDTETILKELKAGGMDLVVVCAMDGIGNIHDKVRNYPNAWEKVNETIHGLTALRKRYPNLIIGLKTTVLPINVDVLEDISVYANQNRLFTIISPCIITRARYRNPDRAADLVFTSDMKQQVADFYRSDLFRWSYHAGALVRYLNTGVMKKPCTCGFNYFFLRSTGEMLLCPLINISPGNIQDRPVDDLFRSKKASEMRRKIGRYPECRQCTEPGLERYALPYEGFNYLSLLMKEGKDSFLGLHRHMGLEKYFDS